MKKVLIIILLGVVLNVNAQEDTIQLGTQVSMVGVEGIIFNIADLEPYFDSKNNTGQVSNLLRGDVIRYYNLQRKYDTDLKKKVFLNSDEGKALAKQMKTLAQNVLSSDFFFLYKLNSRGRTEYNISTKCFDIRCPQICELTTTKKINKYMFFYGLYLSIPIDITYSIKYNNVSSRSTSMNCYDQYISAPLKREDIALEIEENVSDCALLFIFNVQSGVNQGVLCKTKDIFFINVKTGSLYPIKNFK